VFLRSNKKLRFRKLKLIVNGKEVQDAEPAEDEADEA
jgi:hypothetical protein